MANIRLAWTLPTRREDGRTLNRAEIAGVLVRMRVDGIPEFTDLDTVDGESLGINDLEPGTYHFQVIVIDRQAQPRMSAPADASINIPVPILAPPLSVASFTVTIV